MCFQKPIKDSAQSNTLENLAEEFEEEDEEEQELRKMTKSYRGSIRTKHKRQKLVDIVNVKLWDPMNATYNGNIKNVAVGSQAKVNTSAKCILHHEMSGTFR